MKCPFCGTDNPAGEDFCVNCGGYLRDENATPLAAVDPDPIAPADADAVPQLSTSTDTAGGTTTGGGTGNSNSTTLTPNVALQNGRYVVEKVLGQGGMGAAVLARDTRVSNKRVVIKELISDESDPTQRQEDVRNFEREVETLASLDHPLIPTVTDSFQEASRYYMVQEYAPGENLEDYLERVQKPMPEDEALTYMLQVLDILEYLGNQHPPVVHRDIKPANIIISSRDKRARLVDFGIARVDEAKHARKKQTSALGTPGYAPPEQYQGNADARSDLYALAATLHHLVTNRDPREYPPFQYPPVRTINAKISPDLEKLLSRELTMEVEKRYQNAATMKRDVEEILHSRYHKTGDTSSYMLNPSTLSAEIPSVPPPQPGPSPYGGYGPVQRDRSPSTSSGYGGYGPVQSNRPASSPYSGPLGSPGNFGMRQQQRSRRQQQQMYAPRPIRSNPPGNPDSRYILWSFLLLVVVIIIIGTLLFILPTLAHTMPHNYATPINDIGTQQIQTLTNVILKQSI
ncbi:MAG TPA: serine/threonine-protein kinase [Dictyobacter sp.]|jgi:serine/threonine protein kinase|nr:serine/threonine-protein kinase [Dictyobacter sp.]